MKIVQFIALCLLTRAILCYEDDDDDDDDDKDYIVDMDEANLDKAIKENPFLFVEFTSPHCTYCQRIEPAYEDAARQLVKEEARTAIKFARLDATVSDDLREKYGVASYPTFKLFRHEMPVHYNEKYQKNEFVKWLKERTAPAHKTLDNVEEATKFQKEHDISIFGFFKDQDCSGAQFLKNLSFTLDVLDFGMTSKPEVYEHYGITSDGIVLFKNFDEAKAIYDGNYDKETVINWLHVNSLPLVSELNQNIIFVVIDMDEEKEVEELVKLFGVTKDMAPVFRIMLFEEDMVKYKPENGEITEENVAMFTQDYLENKLKPYYLSQDLPNNWNRGPVWTLVSSNFEEVTKRSGKNVLVVFWAEWSEDCEEIEPVVKKLGDHYNRTGRIIVARIDAMLNEFEHLKIKILPSIKLFISDSDQVIEYDGNKSFTSLRKFVDSNGTEDAKKIVEEKPTTQASKMKEEL